MTEQNSELFSLKEKQKMFSAMGHNLHETLLKKILDATDAWPSSDEIAMCLSVATRASQRLIRVSSPLHKDVKEEHNLADLFWVEVVTKYNINLKPALGFDEFFMWLVAHDYHKAAHVAIEKTNEKDLIGFLSLKSQEAITTPLQTTAFDKANNFQMLVLNNKTEVVQSFLSVEPKSILLEDKKGRTVLFTAKSEEMIDVLVNAGVDVDAKNKDGQTAVDFWKENKIPQASKWIEHLCAHTDDPTLSLVAKILSFNNQLNDEEKIVLSEAVNDIDNWLWEGRIGGIERQWSFPEIWKMAECLYIADESPRPSFDQQSYYSYGAVELRLVNDPQYIMGKILHARELFDELTNRAVTTVIFNNKRPISVFENAIDLFSEFKANVSDQETISFKGCLKTNQYYGDLNQEKVKLIYSGVHHRLKLVKDKDKESFVESMTEIMRQNWSAKSLMNFKAGSFLDYLSLYPENGFASGIWKDRIVEDRQDEGLRKQEFVEFFFKTLKANDSLQTRWNETKIKFAETKNVLELDKWSGVLRTGLCYAGIAQYNAPDKIMDIFSDMILTGVPMDKVPVRWSNHFNDNLKSATSNWIIKSSLEKKISKKALPDAPAKKRRM